MPLRRLARPRRLLLAGVTTLALTACGITISETTSGSSQRDVIGDVVLSTRLCSRPDNVVARSSATARAAVDGSGCGQSFNSGRTQALLAYKVPVGSQRTSDTFAASDTVGLTQPIQFTYSSSYSQQLEEGAASGPDFEWVGFISDPFTADSDQRATVNATFTLPRVGEGPFRGPYRFARVAGYRPVTGEGDSGASQPVSCGQVSTCMSAGDAGTLLTQETRDLAIVAGAGDPPSGEAGTRVDVPFVGDFAGATPGEDGTFTLTSGDVAGRTTAPGRSGRVAAGTFHPADDSKTPLKAPVDVPAGTAPGLYSVALTAALANGQSRTGTAQYRVIAPTTTSTATSGATSQTVVVTPKSTPPAAPVAAPKACASRRSFRIRVRERSTYDLASATIFVNGKKVRVVRGKRLRSRVNLTGLPKGTFKVKIVAKTKSGKTLRGVRTFHTCVGKGPESKPKL